ncbi:MAG: FAD/NAD(P)-binding protein, partial [Sodalinema sp.]|uniref:FAD/NAD(P)-binding protein n=1 Tax=Sodalinema sp. TaxID=3080550 RepID=UPI00396F5774
MTVLIVLSLDPLVGKIPETVDIAIIGAGPQALTLVTHLLQKKAALRDRLAVFDRTGTWMAQWKQQFGALEIPHLRSPAVHHPDPNPYALRAFAAQRSSELSPPYDLPGSQLFEEFCEDVIARWGLADGVIGASVVDIEPIQVGGRDRFRLHLQDHPPSLARRVILATG